jgi:hypothetical protein
MAQKIPHMLSTSFLQVSVWKVVPTLTSTSVEIYLSMAGAKQHNDTGFILVLAMGRTFSRGALKVLYCVVVDGRLSYKSSYGFASGQIPRRSQETLLPLSGEPKVSNPWNNVQRKDSI